MTKDEARLILPGAGDLQEMVNQVMRDADMADEFNIEEAGELLDELIKWISEDEDPK